MMKYPLGESIYGAIYDNAPANNPFLAALPEMLPRDEFLSAIRSAPGLPHSLPQMTPEERRQSLPMLSSLFIPMDFMYAVYDQLQTSFACTDLWECGICLPDPGNGYTDAP